jgi:hypothetical protein
MVWTGLRSGHKAVRTQSSGFTGNHHARYAIGLVFPDSTIRWYRFGFSGRSAGLTSGLKLSGPVDTVHRIAASALAGWIERLRVRFRTPAISELSQVRGFSVSRRQCKRVALRAEAALHVGRAADPNEHRYCRIADAGVERYY